MLFLPGPVRPRAAFKPVRIIYVLLATGLFLTGRLGAVQSNGSYVTAEPDVANWTTGWGSGSVTGWDYLGQVGGATGVYLGNGWVLTADHVNPGSFTLSGTTYSYVAGSSRSITSGTDVADLRLFQITAGPSLPLMILAGSSQTLIGATVVMTGFGGGQGKTWGSNTISNDNIPVTLDGYPYTSVDFETEYGGSNQTVLILGDSGGGDFIYSGSQWLLTGINEAVDDSSNSYMVQLGEYANTINPIIAVPEPDTTALLGIGTSIVMLCQRKRFPC